MKFREMDPESEQSVCTSTFNCNNLATFLIMEVTAPDLTFYCDECWEKDHRSKYGPLTTESVLKWDNEQFAYITHDDWALRQ